MLDRDRPGIPPGALIGRLTWANTSDRSGRYRPYRPYSPCRPGPRDTGRLLSVGLHEGDLGQRAALHPLIDDGLRPRTVRAVAAAELLDEEGEDTPALRPVDNDHGRPRHGRDEPPLVVAGDLRLASAVS